MKISLKEKYIELSVVLLTYNRSQLLRKAIESIRPVLAEIDISYEIIVADDCSNSIHREALNELSGVKLVWTKKNSGLGANVNNGLANCNGRLILQIQDDWIYTSNSQMLIDSISFINRYSDIGILQLTTVGSDLPVSRREYGARIFQIFKNDRLPWRRDCSIRPYSDQPHLKRREFVADLGPYLEGVPMTVCENEYKKRVANQIRWKVAMIEAPSSFEHLGAESSTNPGGNSHPLVYLLKHFPMGKAWILPFIRRVIRNCDRFAAKIRTRSADIGDGLHKSTK